MLKDKYFFQFFAYFAWPSLRNKTNGSLPRVTYFMHNVECVCFLCGCRHFNRKRETFRNRKSLILYRHPTPFAAITRQTFRCPAGLFAKRTFWIAGQVTFSPMVFMSYACKVFAWQICSVLPAVCHCKVLTFCVYEVVAYWN